VVFDYKTPLIAFVDNNGWVYDFFGENLPLHKIKLPIGADVISLGDLNGDGIPDIIAGSRASKVYALSGKNLKILWIAYLNDEFFSAPAIADLNKDGTPDVVVGDLSGYLYALSGKNGKPLWIFKADNSIYSSPVIGDLNKDGIPDIIVGSNDNYIYALWTTCLWVMMTWSDIQFNEEFHV